MSAIPITWPFAVWGLDLVGPLQKAPGGYTHLLVTIDKFSKWIEVRPLNSIRSEQAVAFFTNIIHRFGVPNSIITDNGTQFTWKKLLIAIDKFSKWIEVRPLTSIRSKQAVAFFTNIIHRFGVPNSIITDNGT